MARPKKQIKVKEPVTIRFKQLANGNQSIYLDTYHNGKRSYEFLKLYIMPETNADIKAKNEETLKTAIEIKNKRIKAIHFEQMGETDKSELGKILLTDYMDIYADRKEKYGQKHKGKVSMARQVRHTKIKLIAYGGESVRLMDIDKAYCVGYIDFLKALKKEDGTPFSEYTKKCYFKAFTCAMNQAVRDGYIKSNPTVLLNKDERLGTPTATRGYLTENEVKRLVNTPCKNEDVKRAFLFCCFTGLRFSDVENLRWENIVTDGEKKSINIRVIKTAKPLNVPLSKNALMLMGEHGNAKPTDHVFTFPKADNYWNTIVKAWVKSAEITKTFPVTFHVARHTFAVMAIRKGVDLYTLSKLLGHTQIKTTEIYADVINETKEEAVNLLDSVDIQL